jgi:hypothetical protein
MNIGSGLEQDDSHRVRINRPDVWKLAALSGSTCLYSTTSREVGGPVEYRCFSYSSSSPEDDFEFGGEKVPLMFSSL